MINKATLFLITLCLILLGLYSAVANAGKKQCQPYLEKLHKIQSLQRQAHSLKSSNSLNRRESTARDKWWQCEQGKLPVKKKAKKKQKNQISKYKSLPKLDYSVGKIVPFETKKALVFKGRYQGKTQLAWLKYYQQPKACKRPKSTKKFAYCMEDKLNQQSSFEKNYKVIE